MSLDLNYYLAVFWRRMPLFIVIASILTCVGLTMAVVLPPEYEAEATLLVENEQIPQELALSTVQTGPAEQLQIIEQRLMARANLVETANRLGVYDGVQSSDRPMNATDVVDDMRERTTFRPFVQDDALFLSISFRAPSPTLSAEVTNEFVTLVLQENVELRTSAAGDTLLFFEQEVDRLGAELDTQSARIIDFQNQNADALPESLNYLQGREASLQDRLIQIDRELTTQADQRTRIIEIFERTGQLVAGENLSPEQQALADARRQLEEAMLVYAPSNPRVRMLESRVALLEERAAASTGSNEPAANPQQTLLETQLADIDVKVETLEQEKLAVRSELETIRASLTRLPSVTNTLETLRRDQSNIQAQYNQAAADLAVAKTGERIELLSKGQRISVIEQATTPTQPSSPNRALIAFGGVGAGILAGLGVILLLELLNRSIRRPVELTNRLGITPLAVLPYIKTSRERVIKRSIVLAVVLILLVVIPLALYMFHSFVYSLDGLIENVANRFGFSVDLSADQ